MTLRNRLKTGIATLLLGSTLALSGCTSEHPPNAPKVRITNLGQGPLKKGEGKRTSSYKACMEFSDKDGDLKGYSVMVNGEIQAWGGMEY